MLIKQKLNILSVALCAIPALVVGIVCAVLAQNVGTQAFTELMEKRISSIQASKAHEVGAYLKEIKKQIITYSSNQMVVDAMSSFIAAYEAGVTTEQMRTSLQDYYQNTFSPVYEEQNPGRSPRVDDIVQGLDYESLYFQYHYISGNRHPLGEKHKLSLASDGSGYSQTHNYYHPHFRKYLEAFGYYDIFLVDINSGDIIYSVFKELDYTTSLRDGPFSDSGIAKAFRGAAALDRPDDVFFTAFEPYKPSYEANASFIASPIFKGGRKIGVLIFQMPVSEITQIMTSNSSWQSVGLGKYGESYLVGQDGNAINEIRLLREDQGLYLQAIRDNGVDADIVSMIKARESAKGLHPVDTAAADAAFRGEKGLMTLNNYRGRKVISAYTPLEFEGVRWALITDLDHKEAYAGLNRLTGTLGTSALVIAVICAVVGALVGGWFARQLIQPLSVLANQMRAIARGDGDLTKRLPVNGTDEIAQLSEGFNGFAEKVQRTVRAFIDSINTLNTTVSDLNAVNGRSNTLIHEQQQQSDMISTAITEMAASVQEVANNAETVASASEKSSVDTEEAKQVVEGTLKEIEDNTLKIEEAANVINQLADETKSIGSVLDVIRGIAEQTNLLALNAAIEAARAGEQGRGFAVVADEVRTLASRTQASTQEIEEMISRLQAGAANAVAVMAESQERGQSSIKKGARASEAIYNTARAITDISQMMIQVATATEQQSTVADDISANVVKISDLTTKITDEFQELNKAAEQLTHCAQDLDESARAFKV